MSEQFPERMLVGVNTNCHCGIILEHYGDILHNDVENYTIWLEDLGFEPPGFGIWIWEGKADVKNDDKEYVVDWIGNWRTPNIEEWEKLMKNEKLWSYQS